MPIDSPFTLGARLAMRWLWFYLFFFFSFTDLLWSVIPEASHGLEDLPLVQLPTNPSWMKERSMDWEAQDEDFDLKCSVKRRSQVFSAPVWILKIELKLSTLTKNERSHVTAYIDQNARVSSFKEWKTEREREKEGKREEGKKRQFLWTFGSGDKMPVLK